MPFKKVQLLFKRNLALFDGVKEDGSRPLKSPFPTYHQFLPTLDSQTDILLAKLPTLSLKELSF